MNLYDNRWQLDEKKYFFLQEWWWWALDQIITTKVVKTFCILFNIQLSTGRLSVFKYWKNKNCPAKTSYFFPTPFFYLFLIFPALGCEIIEIYIFSLFSKFCLFALLKITSMSYYTTHCKYMRSPYFYTIMNIDRFSIYWYLFKITKHQMGKVISISSWLDLLCLFALT